MCRLLTFISFTELALERQHEGKSVTFSFCIILTCIEVCKPLCVYKNTCRFLREGSLGRWCYLQQATNFQVNQSDTKNICDPTAVLDLVKHKCRYYENFTCGIMTKCISAEMFSIGYVRCAIVDTFQCWIRPAREALLHFKGRKLFPNDIFHWTSSH